MIFRELDVAGVHLVTVEPVTDERGTFARLFSAEEFLARGINPEISQVSVAVNPRRATLRGMHLQLPPHAETKLVRCIRGSAFDVLIDLRAGSPTFLAWTGVTLSGASRDAVSVPEGVAHGYVTLEADTELEYLISAPYAAAASVGVRWNDPAIGVQWPVEPLVVGARDRSFPGVDRARLANQGLYALRPHEAQT